MQDLKELGLWDEVMINDLKYFDGSVRGIDRIPNALKKKYATAFEIDPARLIEAAARRQKWLDQAQSLNLYLAEPDGPLLDKLYKLAWIRGLKTTYYLRTLGRLMSRRSAHRAKGKRGSPRISAKRTSARSSTPLAKPVSKEPHTCCSKR